MEQKDQWNQFKYGDKIYDLKHLRPYTTPFSWPAKGKRPAELFSVNVTFGHHCFTRGLPRDGGAYDSALRLEHAGDVRIFDDGRWMLSRLLPDIIANLPIKKCQQTGKGNFFTVEIVAEDGNPAGVVSIST